MSATELLKRKIQEFGGEIEIVGGEELANAAVFLVQLDNPPPKKPYWIGKTFAFSEDLMEKMRENSFAQITLIQAVHDAMEAFADGYWGKGAPAAQNRKAVEEKETNGTDYWIYGRYVFGDDEIRIWVVENHVMVHLMFEADATKILERGGGMAYKLISKKEIRDAITS